MAQEGFLNGMLDTSKYNSAMPMMGLYIAAATLVCFLCMAFDALNGFRGAKPWVRYKIFSLNSFSLMVISVATKLTFDLNDPMPSVKDQLSKLTGTALLCTSMGFFMPSLGTMRSSQRVTNLAALTIIVGIVIVNMCIQMATGVIFSFALEHVIIMSCMVVLLGALGSSALSAHYQSKHTDGKHKELENKSEGNLESMGGLCKRFYASNYSYTLGVVCVFGATMAVLVALIRSLLHKELGHCDKVSGYKWSMSWVVITQILTILLGSSIVCSRWFCGETSKPPEVK